MKRVLYLVAVATVGLGLTACAPGSASTPKDKLKLPAVLSYELMMPTMVAVAKDYFGEQNIEIEDFVLGSGATLRNAIMAKEYDFGLFAFVQVPLAREAGSPFKMVMAMDDREQFSLVIRSELKDTVKSVADLRGKHVGYTMPGSGTWAIANVYFKRAGLDPERDLQLVSLGADPNVMYTALESGKVDATISWEPLTTRAMSSGVAYPLISIWKPEDHRAWLGSDQALGYGLITREDVIQNKPDLAQRMVRAEQRGLEFIRSSSVEAIADAVLSHPLTRQEFDGVERPMVIDILNRIKPGFGTGCLSRAGFQVEMDLSLQADVLKAPITFDEFADSRFAGECAS